MSYGKTPTGDEFAQRIKTIAFASFISGAPIGGITGSVQYKQAIKNKEAGEKITETLNTLTPERISYDVVNNKFNIDLSGLTQEEKDYIENSGLGERLKVENLIKNHPDVPLEVAIMIEMTENSEYFGDVDYVINTEENLEVFTAEELVKRGYNDYETRFINSEIKEGEEDYDPKQRQYRLREVGKTSFDQDSGRWRIVLNNGATADTVVEEQIEYIYQRLQETNPELRQKIDDYIARVKVIFESNGYIPNRDVEVFSKIMVFNVLGYTSKDIELTTMATMPKEISEPFMAELGRQSDGSNIAFLWQGGKQKEGILPVSAIDETGAVKPDQTQTEQVIDLLEGAEDPQSIQEVAEKTEILEPNVRRILGTGAKDGTFTRIGPGIYTIEGSNGEKIAHIEAGEAQTVLPKLVASGQKFDMIFLDPAYFSEGLKGGNRGIKTDRDWEFINETDFATVMENVKQLIQSPDSHVYLMTSGARTTQPQMQQYLGRALEVTFSIAGEGSYTKLNKDGSEFKNMRGDVIPERIFLLTESGDARQGEVETNLNLRTVRVTKRDQWKTEKAPELLEALIKGSTFEGESVLDPFAGSGVTGDEAIKAGRAATLVDKESRSVEGKIVPRLSETTGLPITEYTSDDIWTESQPNGTVSIFLGENELGNFETEAEAIKHGNKVLKEGGILSPGESLVDGSDKDYKEGDVVTLHSRLGKKYGPDGVKLEIVGSVKMGSEWKYNVIPVGGTEKDNFWTNGLAIENVVNESENLDQNIDEEYRDEYGVKVPKSRKFEKEGRMTKAHIPKQPLKYLTEHTKWKKYDKIKDDNTKLSGVTKGKYKIGEDGTVVNPTLYSSSKIFGKSQSKYKLPKKLADELGNAGDVYFAEIDGVFYVSDSKDGINVKSSTPYLQLSDAVNSVFQSYVDIIKSKAPVKGKKGVRDELVKKLEGWIRTGKPIGVRLIKEGSKPVARAGWRIKTESKKKETPLVVLREAPHHWTVYESGWSYGGNDYGMFQHSGHLTSGSALEAFDKFVKSQVEKRNKRIENQTLSPDWDSRYDESGTKYKYSEDGTDYEKIEPSSTTETYQIVGENSVTINKEGDDVLESIDADEGIVFIGGDAVSIDMEGNPHPSGYRYPEKFIEQGSGWQLSKAGATRLQDAADAGYKTIAVIVYPNLKNSMSQNPIFQAELERRIIKAVGKREFNKLMKLAQIEYDGKTKMQQGKNSVIQIAARMAKVNTMQAARDVGENEFAKTGGTIVGVGRFSKIALGDDRIIKHEVYPAEVQMSHYQRLPEPIPFKDFQKKIKQISSLKGKNRPITEKQAMGLWMMMRDINFWMHQDDSKLIPKLIAAGKGDVSMLQKDIDEGVPSFQITGYHGSGVEFDQFDIGKVIRANYGYGIYSTVDPGTAYRYAKAPATGEGELIYKLTIHRGKKPSEYDYMPWYGSITSAQINKINTQLDREGLSAYIDKEEKITGKGVDKLLNQAFAKELGSNEENTFVIERMISSFLLRAGIDGNSIEDLGVYVTFDDSAIDIERRTDISKTPYESKTYQITGDNVPADVYSRSNKVKKADTQKTSWWTNYIIPLSTRIKRISPELHNMLRHYEFDYLTNTNNDKAKVKSFVEKFNALEDDIRRVLDLALKNGDQRVINNIVSQYDMEEDYKAVRDVLDNLYQGAVDAGIEVGYLPGYFPRKVINVEALLESLDIKVQGVFDRAISEKEKELDRELTKEERASIINGLIGTGQIDVIKSTPDAAKARTIEHIDDELNFYYQDPTKTLLDYIDAMHQSISTANIFGRGKDDINSVGAYISGLLRTGDITREQQNELVEILGARFNQNANRSWVAPTKNIMYMATMGSPTSAITQIGDMAWAMYEGGFYTPGAVLRSIAGKSKIKLKDVGIDKISQEFQVDNDGGLTQKTYNALNLLFKMTGLTKMDSVGKETLMNAAVNKYMNKARRNNPKLMAELNHLFGSRAEDVYQALVEGRVTDDVLFMAFNTLSDFQPVSLLELPQGYVENVSGRARMLYQLKTFTIKQLDVFRNRCIDQIRKGNVVEGMGNLIKLAGLYTVAQGSADAIKDL